MSLARKEVMIVDDDADVRLLLRRILENIGVTVCEAETVTAAFEMYAKRSPHLIITDLQMEPDSGFVLLASLRAAYGKVPVPVIVLSALDDRKSIRQAMALGISDFVVKPLNAAKLLQKVRKSIRKEELCSYAFPKGAPCPVSITVPARIVAASEIGFRLVAGVRLDSQTQVTVKSDYLSSLGLQDYPLRSGPIVAKSVEPGQYNNEIRLPGVSQEISLRVRKLLLTWK